MNREVTLPEAAQRLRTAYGRAYDLVLRGELRARRDKSGRWQVLAQDVERLERAASGSTALPLSDAGPPIEPGDPVDSGP